MPIERAVPMTVRLAASISVVFKSGNLVWAISSICLRVRVAIFSRWVLPEPFERPVFFLRRSETGGFLMMKSKERSS